MIPARRYSSVHLPPLRGHSPNVVDDQAPQYRNRLIVLDPHQAVPGQQRPPDPAFIGSARAACGNKLRPR